MLAAARVDAYTLVARDGGVFTYGGASFHGSTGNLHLSSPIVGLAERPSQDGYWIVAADGGVFAFGNAGFHGSLGAVHLRSPIVGIAATPSGNGYWLVAADGGVFSFGDATFFGSTGGIRLHSPIVGIAATSTGQGYWMVAADGGIFAFGDAPFFGSTGGIRLNSPIVGITATTAGDGYWMVAADGGIFAFGTAGFHGSAGSIRLNSPIVGLAATHSGGGYWIVGADGGVFNYGDASFEGSAGALRLGSPIVGIGVSPDVAPSLTLSGSGSGAATLSNTGHVTVSGLASDPDDAVGSVEVGVDGAAFSTSGVTCTGCGSADVRFTFTAASALSDGTHQLRIRAVDSLGLVSSAASATILVDTHAPTVTITGGPADGSVTADATPTFSGSAGDGGSGVMRIAVSLDGGAFSSSGVSCSNCGSGHAAATWTGQASGHLADGPHTFAVESVDAAGNLSVSASHHFTVDTTPPAAPAVVAVPTVNAANHAAVSVSGTAEANSTVALTVADGGSGSVVAHTTADGSGNWTVSGLDLSTLADGSVGATATATDAAGNVSAVSSAHLAVKDTVPPAVSVTAAGDANLTTQSNVAVSGTTEAGAGVTVVASDGTHSTGPVLATVAGNGSWNATVDVSSLDDGTVTYTATATDAALNVGTDATTATKDTVVPTLDGITATDLSTTVTLHFSEAVQCSGSSTFVVTVGGLPDVMTVDCSGPAGTTLTGTLAVPALLGQDVDVTPGAGAVTDVTGNAVASVQVSAITGL